MTKKFLREKLLTSYDKALELSQYLRGETNVRLITFGEIEIRCCFNNGEPTKVKVLITKNGGVQFDIKEPIENYLNNLIEEIYKHFKNLSNETINALGD